MIWLGIFPDLYPLVVSGQHIIHIFPIIAAFLRISHLHTN